MSMSTLIKQEKLIWIDAGNRLSPIWTNGTPGARLTKAYDVTIEKIRKNTRQ